MQEIYTDQSISIVDTGSVIDIDGDDLEYIYYDWYRNGDEIVHADTSGVLSSENYVRGDNISVVVRVSDGIVTSEKIFGTYFILNTAPEITSCDINTSRIDDSQIIFLDTDYNDIDNDYVFPTYHWYKNEVLLSQVDNVSEINISEIDLQKGDTLSVDMFVNDGDLYSTGYSCLYEESSG
ncbi:MAG: hypothetical protein U9Q15_02980 [Patescibacteria group bacterium]|nr:hypothetical protein [Patescibacteria group bacterium]